MMETASYDIKEVNAKTWHSTLAEVATLRRQLEEEQHASATLDAARAVAVAERDDLRRQVVLANNWRRNSAATWRAESRCWRQQVAAERMRANAAEFAVAQLRDDAAELRRQLMAVTIDRNQLRSLWLEYRQRLADTTAEIADLRQRKAGQA